MVSLVSSAKHRKGILEYFKEKKPHLQRLAMQAGLYNAYVVLSAIDPTSSASNTEKVVGTKKDFWEFSKRLRTKETQESGSLTKYYEAVSVLIRSLCSNVPRVHSFIDSF